MEANRRSRRLAQGMELGVKSLSNHLLGCLAITALLLDPSNLWGSESPSIFDPATPQATSIRSLFWLVILITGVIFVGVEGLLAFFLYEYSRKKSDPNAEPAQVYGSIPIEVAWTAVPTLIVFVIVMIVVRIEYEVKADAETIPANSIPLRIRVVGHQWWWEYNYFEYDGKPLSMTTANELVIPVGEEGVARPIMLTLESADVCHSYWVPRLSGKTDLIPGRVNELWFETKLAGDYVGQCAEYCGTQHANMLLHVRAVSPDEFEKWLSDQASPAADDPAVAEGKKVFLSETCVNCHTVQGTAAKGRVGPDLTHLMSRHTIAAGMISNTPEHLRDWIHDPQDIKPGCLMPAFRLESSKMDLLVKYLGSLK